MKAECWVFYFIEYAFTDKRMQAVIQTGSKFIPLAHTHRATQTLIVLITL